jgi:ribosomal protein L20
MNVLDPIKKFWNSEQKKIYDSVNRFLIENQSNLEYMDSEELNVLTNMVNDAKPFSGSIIKDAKKAKDTLYHRIQEKIRDEKEKAKEALQRSIQKIEAKTEFKDLGYSEQSKILAPFNHELTNLQNQKFIANIQRTAANAGQLLTKQLDAMMKMITPYKVDEPAISYINRNEVKVNYYKDELKTEQDVKEYVQALEKELITLIKNNKRITL